MCQPGRPGPHGLSQARLAGIDLLPEEEVERSTLLVFALGFGIFALGEFGHGHAVQNPVPRELRRFEKDVPVDHVAAAVRDDLLCRLDDLRDVVGCARIGPGTEDVEAIEVVPEDGVVLIADLGDGAAALSLRYHDHVVIDIGDVLDVADFVAERGEVPAQRVELDVREGVAKMRDVVRGDSADVHAHDAGLHGSKLTRVLTKRRIEA